MVYNSPMYEIIKSETFERWLLGLKDRAALHRINARIRRVSIGNFGDTKSVRDGIFEFRVDYGPGYRIYYMKSGPLVIVLLAGGDKSTQDADIKKAITIAKSWRN
jgi:putative addiction module killer protein